MKRSDFLWTTLLAPLVGFFGWKRGAGPGPPHEVDALNGCRECIAGEDLEAGDLLTVRNDFGFDLAYRARGSKTDRGTYEVALDGFAGNDTMFGERMSVRLI